MSRKYVWHLAASERELLTRIAKGRCGRHRPAGWKMERARALLKCDEGPEGEGWTDEAIAAALDVSARSVGRWRRQAVEAGPEAVLDLYCQPYDARDPVICMDEQPNSGCPKRGRRSPRNRDGPPPTTTNTCGTAPAPSGCSWSR